MKVWSKENKNFLAKFAELNNWSGKMIKHVIDNIR